MFDKLEVFRALRGLRKRLMDSGTFDQAAAEVRSWVAGVEPAAEAAPQAGGPSEPPASPQAGEGEGQGDLLGRLLGERPAHVGEPASRPAPGGAGIDALLRDIVAPHVVPDRDREQSALAARVDEAVAAQMRAILHDAHFQAAEAAWRSVHFLVTHLETDEDLKLYVMDLTKEELADDLTAGEDLQATALFRTLVSQTVGTQGGEPWSVLAGGFRFDKTAGDASLLGRLAKIARAAGAPFVGAAHDRVAGCESLAASPDPESWSLPPDADAAGAWAELRKLPEASWLALGLPRMLLRLPYGRETDPIDAFELEELAEGCGHECYLWGSPAFAIAQVLGAGFTEHGWGMAAELYRDIESLPMHVYRREGERHVMPCAEVYLTDRAGQRLQEMGLTALLSVQGRDVIRVRGVAALREPVTALAGRWGA
jgi:type VI secretion system protein ImpC